MARKKKLAEKLSHGTVIHLNKRFVGQTIIAACHSSDPKDPHGYLLLSDGTVIVPVEIHRADPEQMDEMVGNTDTPSD
jgi:hypothetical protein